MRPLLIVPPDPTAYPLARLCETLEVVLPHTFLFWTPKEPLNQPILLWRVRGEFLPARPTYPFPRQPPHPRPRLRRRRRALFFGVPLHRRLPVRLGVRLGFLEHHLRRLRLDLLLGHELRHGDFVIEVGLQVKLQRRPAGAAAP